MFRIVIVDRRVSSSYDKIQSDIAGYGVVSHVLRGPLHRKRASGDVF